jgi:hypothetical protein
MLATGAGLDRLDIFRDTSGLATPMRGVSAPAQAAISSAGYMGTAFFGALFLILGRTGRGARWVLAGIGAAMLVMVAIGVRNPFGVVALVAEAAALGCVARWGENGWAAFLVNLLAAQSCINAVLDIRVLFGAEMYVDGARAASDADTMARVVFGPAALWAFLWLAWSFALFYVALRFVRHTEPQPALAAAVSAS